MQFSAVYGLVGLSAGCLRWYKSELWKGKARPDSDCTLFCLSSKWVLEHLEMCVYVYCMCISEGLGVWEAFIDCRFENSAGPCKRKFGALCRFLPSMA